MVGVRRDFIKNLAALLLSLLLTLAGLETAARLDWLPAARPAVAEQGAYRQIDLELHHSLKPGASGRQKHPSGEYDVSYQISSQGLRDREHSVHKPASVYRILMLGDSFTEGYGVELEQTVAKILERRLNSSVSNRKYEVINAGIAGYSTILEYLLLTKRLTKLDSDLVI